MSQIDCYLRTSSLEAQPYRSALKQEHSRISVQFNETKLYVTLLP